MKLTIKRSQADVKGLFGGHKGVAFSLASRAEVTPEEAALIERYKVGDHVLASYQIRHKNDAFEVTYTVNDMIRGKTAELTSISSLLALEEEIKNGCRGLKALLEVMRTFGGEEVVEI